MDGKGTQVQKEEVRHEGIGEECPYSGKDWDNIYTTGITLFNEDPTCKETDPLGYRHIGGNNGRT